jgi:glycosyltransferase involved in cell wall biosynthesis
MHDLAEGLGYGCDVIPLGVDARLFTPQGISKAPNSNRTQIRTQKRLLHVASLNKVKDQATLLRAMQHVVKHEPDVHLDIIGEDTLNGAVQAHCAELGLNHCVTFHGFLPTDEIVPFYRRADLFVLPSRHDAAPVVVLEAAMCGIPTIGTAVGYVKDWAPERAYAVPISDSDALADGILTLLHDDERRRRMGQAAQAWALAHDADWTAQRFEDLYTQLITARTHRS